MTRIIFFIVSLLLSPIILAVCPLCTFTVGAGIGLGQYCGLDDLVSGLWIGGFIISLIYLTNNWIEKNKFSFYGYKTIVTIGYYFSVILPLYLTGLVGHELNKFWGIDKIILGIIIGSVSFFAGILSYEFLKRYNNNRAYFPFQKVIMPLVPLIILSIIFCFLTK